MKPVDDFEQFSASCFRGRCLRNTIYNAKTCSRDGKQRQCHGKYLEKIQKTAEKRQANKGRPGNPDPEYDALVEACWKRDAGYVPAEKHMPKSWKRYCKIWKCLTPEERQVAERQTGFYLNAHLDVSHIKGKGPFPELKYVLENVILAGRFFSNRLDTYTDPVDGSSISDDERQAWFERARDFSP